MPEAVCNTAHPQHGDYTAQCGDLKQKLQKSDTFHNAGVGVLVVGGVIAAGTIIYAVWPKKARATMGLEVLPAVAPTFAGIVASGRF
jgi:hypothetical protein